MVVCTVLYVIEPAYKPRAAPPSWRCDHGHRHELPAAEAAFDPSPTQSQPVVNLPVRLFDGRLLISDEPIVTVLCCTLWSPYPVHPAPGWQGHAGGPRGPGRPAMGVDVNLTISVTFAIGPASPPSRGAAVPAYPVLQPTTGPCRASRHSPPPCWGHGSIPAPCWGILLGIIEIFGKAYISTELGMPRIRC